MKYIVAQSLDFFWSCGCFVEALLNLLLIPFVVSISFVAYIYLVEIHKRTICVCNKTASFHQHLLCLPIFVKQAFRKMKKFFSWKHFLTIIVCSFLRKAKFSKFLPKIQKRAENIFNKQNHLSRILKQICHL